MSITINNSQNNVSITENNGNLEIIDNNTATSVNIPIEISTIATIASQGPKGDKGNTGPQGPIGATGGVTSSTSLTVTGSVTASGNISASGDIQGSSLTTDQYIKHTGDGNTYLNFTDNRVRFEVGGISYLDLNDATSAPHDITFNNGGHNVDLTIKGTSNNPLFKTDANTGRIGTTGKGSPEADFHIGGNLKTDSHITASGNISASGTGYFSHIVVKDKPTGINIQGTSSHATYASQTYVNNLESGDTETYIPFITNPGAGYRTLYEDSELKYNTDANILTVPNISSSGMISGSSLAIANHITASGDISASGTGSFDKLGVGTADFGGQRARLHVKGRIWSSRGSGDINDMGIFFSSNGTSEDKWHIQPYSQSLRFTESGVGTRLTLSGSNVGIGTTAPQSTLHIKSAGTNTGGLIFQNSHDYVRQYFSGDSDNDSFLITYDGTGGAEIQLKADGDLILNGTNGDNVGIGTTTPQYPLDVSGSARLGGNEYTTTLYIESTGSFGLPAMASQIQMKGYENRGVGTFYKDHDEPNKEWFVGVPYQNSNLTRFQIGYSNQADGRAEYQASASITIRDDGDVGIGTTDPGEKLEVVGNISASGTGSFEYGHFIHDVGIGVAPTGIAALQVRDITPDTHTSILIDSTGGADKDVNLSLSSSAQHWRIKQYAQGVVGTGQYELQIADVNNANAKVVRIATGQSSNTLVLSGSNVGIGQLNPGEKLEVVGNISSSGNVIARKAIIRAGTGGGLLFDDDGDGQAEASITHTGGGINIHAYGGNPAGSTHLFVTQSGGTGMAHGKVGIGTMTPSEQLEVVGNISASGTGSFGRIMVGGDDPSVNEIEIYANSVGSYIQENGGGYLFIRGANALVLESDTGENYFKGNKDGDVKLYYDNLEKFATTNTGINVIGDITASGDIITKGNLIAQQYIVSSSVTHLTQSFSSGSTIFGDTGDDTHQFTGSISITGSITSHITASGHISGSLTSNLTIGGDIIANKITLTENGFQNIVGPKLGLDSVGQVQIDSAAATIGFSRNGTNAYLINPGISSHDFTGHITASGNIWQSGSSNQIIADGNISASGGVYSQNAYVNDAIYFGNGNNDFVDSSISASSDILTLSDNSNIIAWIDKNEAASTGVFKVQAHTSKTTLLTVSSSGNVGIGTQTPGENLEVVGNISASGYISASAIYAHTIYTSGSTLHVGSETFKQSDLELMKAGKPIVSEENQKTIGATGNAEAVSNSRNYIKPQLWVHESDNESALIHNTAHKLSFRTAGGDPLDIYTDGSSNDYVKLGSSTNSGATQIELRGSVTASNIAASGYVSASNFYTDNTRIKILPRDFVPGNVGRPVMTNDDTFLTASIFSYGSDNCYAHIDIPFGYSAIYAKISGSDTAQNFVTYEANIGHNRLTIVGSATNINTECALTTTPANDDNYLVIGITSDGASDEIFGGYVTIQPTR